MAQVEGLLWDFGDTLCDERFICSSGPECIRSPDSIIEDMTEFCTSIRFFERTDRRILNRFAIERLGLNCENKAALLIDNKISNVTDWIGVGGSGYHHTGDAFFSSDAAAGIDAMAAEPG